MTSLVNHAFCAMLSTMGAAGLVVFADPANAVGATAQPHAAMLAAATIAAPAHRG